MSSTAAVIDRLRFRFEASQVTCLRDAIDAFEQSYQQDRVDDDDSLTIVGWPKPDLAAFDLALGRGIGGGACEFPTIITAALLIPLEAGDSFPTEVDEELRGLEIWEPGQIFLQCKGYVDAETYFAKLRSLAVTRKYGETVPISCKLEVLSEGKKAEIASKLVEYFAEHGWPCEDDTSGGLPR